MKNILPVIYFTLLCLLFTPFLASSDKGISPEEAPVKEEETESAPVTVTEQPVQEEELKTGKISGKVIDESGTPAAGVDVACVDDKGVIIVSTVTDENGNYVFENIEKGEYIISVSYSGFTSPIEIKFDDKEELPANPSGLKVWEIGRDIDPNSYIYARWNQMRVSISRDAISYKCELYEAGNEIPLVQYPDIKQSFCEFGNLKEDTAYEVRVYSKNSIGYSASYTSATIRTENKAPLSPFGLGVTYAKNNRVDLIWDSSREDDLKGYIIQIKKEKDSYLYYSKEGLTPTRSRAFIIEKTENGLMSYSITDRLQDRTPILDNATFYSFRVFSIDEKGVYSKPSTAVKGIILEDTVPPNPPYGIKYEFKGKDILRLSWKSDDKDVEKFILYYGVKKDRWDGVVSTDKNFYELIIDSERLRDEELFITIKAVDRSGNESGYKPVMRSTTVSKPERVTEDIVLSANNIYKDYSVAVREPASVKKKKITVQKPVYQKTYGFSTLKEKGFIVKKGETAVVTGKITVPENKLIEVMDGGSLIIKDAKISAVGGKWGGIQYKRGASGSIRNTAVSDAVIGITIFNNEKGIKLNNVEITGSIEVGIYIKNSSAELSFLTVRNNNIGLYIENSNVAMSNFLIDNNEKGILSNNYRLNITNSQFNNNRVYGIRLYGGGKIVKCSVKNNLAGIVLEAGKGSAELYETVIELNRMDGIVVNATNIEIRQNLISNNGRHGIYLKENSNPVIFENDIINNKDYAVIGGGKVTRCFIAYNNGSAYVDDTGEKGKPDSIFSSSSSGILKQIFNVDYINDLTLSSVLRY